MENLKASRLGFETLGDNYTAAANVIRENTSIAGISCSWFIPSGAPEDDIIFYIHGGAFILGSVHSHAAMVSHIASRLNRKILAIDYRLAPEHPFPAGLEDCATLIQTFCAANPGVQFGIIGDSAGGNLTMATQLKLKASNGLKIQYSIVISPWTDLECKNPSYLTNSTLDIVLNRKYLQDAAKTYAGREPLTQALLSPVNGNFKQLAPVLILCGTDEILVDDSVYLHQRLLESGVEAEIKLFEHELHVWPLMDIHTKASVEALTHMANFISRHTQIKQNATL